MDELLPIFVKIQSNWWIDVFLPPLVTGILTGSLVLFITNWAIKKNKEKEEKIKEKRTIINLILRLNYNFESFLSIKIAKNNADKMIVDPDIKIKIENFLLRNNFKKILFYMYKVKRLTFELLKLIENYNSSEKRKETKEGHKKQLKEEQEKLKQKNINKDLDEKRLEESFQRAYKEELNKIKIHAEKLLAGYYHFLKPAIDEYIDKNNLDVKMLWDFTYVKEHIPNKKLLKDWEKGFKETKKKK